MASPFPTGPGSVAGPGNQPIDDHSVTINNPNFGYSQNEVSTRLQNHQMQQIRQPLRSVPR